MDEAVAGRFSATLVVPHSAAWAVGEEGLSTAATPKAVANASTRERVRGELMVLPDGRGRRPVDVPPWHRRLGERSLGA
ncbi:hypothetical protein GCM10010185_50340 [Saccharothrix coeruleofusca]|uniref:Uncharacterized protein n=1 Tax=Saccharothrix coeruleofusca TaxID=33919 RepID=A0A918EG76_9PSEU|nr:hypothetical protein GCM10010185_50340 [Saccharothrix coeruleofusca]